ncbi:MAG: PAS domain S-box protein [Acidobacteriota bacterium]
MSVPLNAPVVVISVVSLLAGIAAVVLCLVAIGLLRRALRRLAAQLADLRRHPRVGAVPLEPDPTLGPLTRELNGLIDDLRAEVRDAESRGAELRALAQGPPDIALIGVDSEWRVIAFSRGAVRLTGWAAEEILGHHVEVLFASQDWERVLPKLSRRSVRESGIADTVSLQRRDGTTFPARLSAGGAAAEEGPGGAILIAARDLAEEQALERRLRESEERYRRLVEGIRDGAVILKGGRVAYANPAMAHLLGIERERLRDRPFKEFVGARDVMRVVEVLREAERQEGSAGEMVCRLTGREGRAVEARLAWAGIDFGGGRAVIGTVTDLTERARFEKAIVESEARLRATLESTADGILVIGARAGEQAVLMVNRGFTELFGLYADHVVALPAGELSRTLTSRCTEPERLETFLAAAMSGTAERLDGIEFGPPRRAVVDLASGPVRSARGDTLGIILTARDVTARVDGERQLRQTLDELSRAKSEVEVAYRELAGAQKKLAERNRQLEGVNAELRSLDEMKSNLLANVSHELHTPLVSIKGYTEMVLKRRLGPLTPEQERGLSVALKNIDRLIEMIDNLLSFSRMEKGETELHLENIPFWQLVDEAIEIVGERIKKKDISLTTRYDADDLVVRGDRVKIVQVMTNLLTNAVKFNRESGRITLAARKGPRGFLEVDVADTGIGIPREEQARIFERFYQVDSSPSRKYEGTGIGLSIVRDILRLHGCSIRVRSEPGRGSVFTFSLPLARDREPSESRRPASRDRSAR